MASQRFHWPSNQKREQFKIGGLKENAPESSSYQERIRDTGHFRLLAEVHLAYKNVCNDDSSI